MKDVAWFSDEYINGDIKGVALSFHGCGVTSMKTTPETYERAWAQKGWLVIYPYYGPWSWMNSDARAFVDELVDAVYENYALDDNIPLVCTGMSMGGLASFIYSRYAKRRVSACLAIFPACDLRNHINDRPVLPRSIHHAFRGYPGDMDTFFKENSPIEQIENLPDIPYLIVQGDCDTYVNKELHSDKMVALMKERNLKVRYIEVSGMEHQVEKMPIQVILDIIAFLNDLI
jgi:dipeptidyl aminopeptidase/acylaminoacyl peptidase